MVTWSKLAPNVDSDAMIPAAFRTLKCIDGPTRVWTVSRRRNRRYLSAMGGRMVAWAEGVAEVSTEMFSFWWKNEVDST